MLWEIKIDNFRCLRNVKVPLKPLTVLIGPNDTGKSVFLAAVERLWHSSINYPADFWMGERGRVPSIIGQARLGPIRVGEGGRVDGSDGEHVQDIVPITSFYLPSQGVLMEGGGQAEGDPSPPQLSTDGKGVAALADYFLRRDRPRFDAFVAAMKELVQGLEDIRIATPDAARRRIDLVLGKDFVIPADRVSAGVRLLLFFVALAYHPLPPKLILLEEPENGIHPRRLEDIVKLLRDITQGVHAGHKAQVILTTHSPYLLDCIDVDKDQVLVFLRQKDGSRTAKPVDGERLKDYLKDFMLGEIWYNRQEEGLVGEKDA